MNKEVLGVFIIFQSSEILSNATLLRTTVSSINHPPVFDRQSYEFIVNNLTTDKIGTLKITDPDGDTVVNIEIQPEKFFRKELANGVC